MLPTIVPPAEWPREEKQIKSSINVLERRKIVRGKVYRNGLRKIYKLESTDGFAGNNGEKTACLFISGCSFFCQFCFVIPTSLSGVKGNFYSPRKAFERLKRMILCTENPHVQINGGELFLTPEWALELIRLLSEFFEKDCPFTSDKHPGIIWCDTMGFDLMQEQHLFKDLGLYRKHVALFLSTKGHPDDFPIVARAPVDFADDSFLALERAWECGLVAMPEVLDRMFWPQRMDWYMKRLQAIHPDAPKVLHLDYYSPICRVGAWSPHNKMKVIGFRPYKDDPKRNAPLREEAIAAWQQRLEAVYGSPWGQPLYDGTDSPAICCDRYPDKSFRLVEELILNS